MIKYFHYSTLFKRKVKVTYLQQKLYSCSPVAAVAPHQWSLLQSQTHLKNFPHSRICFIIIISITNKSIFQSFLSLYLMFFSLHPLMLSSFIQPQLSFFQADIIENPYSSITHMLLFYACSFPYNNIYTYIMYIFRVSILMCKCSYDSILLYSIHVKSLLLLSNFQLLLSNFQLLLSNFELLLFNFQLLLSDFELLMFDFSNYYCLTLNRYCLTFPTVTV